MVGDWTLVCGELNGSFLEQWIPVYEQSVKRQSTF